jgi:hypothetical protein
MPPRTDPLPSLTANELALLARLEGRPLPRGGALAAALGVSTSAARRILRKLRGQGWLAFAGVARPTAHGCACISYLAADWSRTARQTLEDRLRQDPAILVADRILGAADYRLFSSHGDHRAANAWARALSETPGVGRLTTKICANVCDRPRFAAARLAADAASPHACSTPRK